MTVSLTKEVATIAQNSQRQTASELAQEKTTGVKLRNAAPEDAAVIGKIMYEAFCGIADRHNFMRDFPSPEAAVGLAQMCIANRETYGVVAEKDGAIVGSNFLWEQNEIAGVGPITVNPNGQASGVGRRLMQAVIERGNKARGIRLVQDAFNSTSMSLYASLGFDIKEPLVVMQGAPAGEVSDNVEVRQMQVADLAACGELYRTIHGFDRNNELKFTMQILPAFVAVRAGKIVAYTSAPLSWQMNHAAAETRADLQAVLAGAAKLTGEPLSFLLPTRQAELFRWCLASGLRVVKPMSLMVMGEYREPRGAFLPSVIY